MKNQNYGKVIASGILSLVALMFVACESTSGFHSETKDGLAEQDIRTFAIEPIKVGEGAIGEKAALAIRYSDTIEATIASNLRYSGYRQVSIDEADITIRVASEFHQETEVTELPRLSRPIYTRRGIFWVDDPWGPKVDVYNYEVGTISVDATLNETGEVVWVGWSEVRNVSKIPALNRIVQFFDGIMSNFPVVE